MAIEYTGEPEFARRQPAARTLTEAEAAELNDRQAFLLPDVNIGRIRGRMSVVPNLGGRMSVETRLTGRLSVTDRLQGDLRVSQ